MRVGSLSQLGCHSGEIIATENTSFGPPNFGSFFGGVPSSHPLISGKSRLVIFFLVWPEFTLWLQKSAWQFWQLPSRRTSQNSTIILDGPLIFNSHGFLRHL